MLLTDMTCAQPPDAWIDTDSNVLCQASKKHPDCWRAIDYRTELFSRRLLAATGPGAPGRIEVRLTGDTHRQLFRSDPDVGKIMRGNLYQRVLSEEPWTFADLTGRDIGVRRPPDMAEMQLVGIWSVRAVPVEPADLPVVQSKRHRPMVYLNDGGGIFASADQPGPYIVEQALAPFKNSDWDICCFGHAMGDLVDYPSKVGTLPHESGGWHFYRKEDANRRKVLEATIAAGRNPLRQTIDLAHKYGHRCWACLRPQGWAFDLIYDHIFRSPFIADHPEWRCVLQDGRKLAMMSIAYDGVRRRLNAMLKEAIERDADGLCIAFVRGFPLVRYELPALNRFRELYGTDACDVSDTDERLRSVWKEFVTEWLREIRATLDEAGPRSGDNRREQAVIVGAYPDWDAQYGIDVAAWAREGLPDAVLLYPQGLEHPTSPIPAGNSGVALDENHMF